MSLCDSYHTIWMITTTSIPWISPWPFHQGHMFCMNVRDKLMSCLLTKPSSAVKLEEFGWNSLEPRVLSWDHSCHACVIPKWQWLGNDVVVKQLTIDTIPTNSPETDVRTNCVDHSQSTGWFSWHCFDPHILRHVLSLTILILSILWLQHTKGKHEGNSDSCDLANAIMSKRY